MRLLLFTKFASEDLQETLKRKGILVVKSNPDLVLCWGGDGTFLLAEQRYPGVPKVLVRKDNICKKCSGLTLDEVIERLAGNADLNVQELSKIQSTIKRSGVDIELPAAVNDIVIRNEEQMHALRFSVFADDEHLAPAQIGDGVVVSTPFGSSAYYQSITRDSFERGIGIALNNTVKEHPPYLVAEDSEVVVRIDRGNALVSIDTLEKTWKMHSGDRIIISASDEKARLVRF